jgi:hypothetical protein
MVFYAYERQPEYLDELVRFLNVVLLFSLLQQLAMQHREFLRNACISLLELISFLRKMGTRKIHLSKTL